MFSELLLIGTRVVVSCCYTSCIAILSDLEVLRVRCGRCFVGSVGCRSGSCFSSVKNPWRMMLSSSTNHRPIHRKHRGPLGSSNVALFVWCFDAHWDRLLTRHVWWGLMVMLGCLGCVHTARDVPALDYIHITSTAWAVLWVFSNGRKSCLNISIHHHWLHRKSLLLILPRMSLFQ